MRSERVWNESHPGVELGHLEADLAGAGWAGARVAGSKRVMSHGCICCRVYRQYTRPGVVGVDEGAGGVS